MTKKPENNEKVNEYTLNESVDITTINQFYTELKNLLQQTDSVVIDAKDVKRLDTAALQLLCSWHKEAEKKNISIKWKNIDGVFFNSAKLLGVTEHLALE